MSLRFVGAIIGSLRFSNGRPRARVGYTTLFNLAAIRAVGAEVLYLPPYSPDFNPIELALSKIKQALRSLANRTVAALWGTMPSVLDRVSPSDAEGFFQHCGYATQKN